MTNTLTDAFGNPLETLVKSLQMEQYLSEINSIKFQDWTEKYRPRNIDEILLPRSQKNMVKNSIDPKYGVSNMTFCSNTPGTCKTTTAIALAEQMGAQYKVINASSDGRLATVQDEIIAYGMQRGMNGSYKIVILDEIDGATSSAFQDSLRGVIDRFKDSLRFILTCNNLHKVIGPLQSRCPPVFFNKTEDEEEEKDHKNDIYKRLNEIALNETGNKDFVNTSTIKQVIVDNYPDVRIMVEALQFNFKKNGGKIDGKAIYISNAGVTDIWNFIVAGNWEEARMAYNKTVSNSGIFFREFLDYALMNVDKKHMKDIALRVAEFQYRSTSQVDQEINITCGLFPSIINYLSQAK